MSITSTNNINEESAIDYLAAVIFFSSVDSAEMFKEMPSDRYLQTLFEFAHFYVHLMNRASLRHIGDDGRRILHSKVLPLVFSAIMDASVSAPVSDEQRQEVLGIFMASNYDREFIYSRCTRYTNVDNPLDKNALFSKVAMMIADALGAPHDERFAKAVIGISCTAYEGMDLVNLVNAAQPELGVPSLHDRSKHSLDPERG